MARCLAQILFLTIPGSGTAPPAAAAVFLSSFRKSPPLRWPGRGTGSPGVWGVGSNVPANTVANQLPGASPGSSAGHPCAQMAPGLCPAAGGLAFLDLPCPAVRVPSEVPSSARIHLHCPGSPLCPGHHLMGPGLLLSSAPSTGPLHGCPQMLS